MEITSEDAKVNVIRRIGSQPIALAAGALVILVVGVASIGLWRAYTGASPEQERTTSARLMQTRAVQASEQLVEKTKGLEASQQESIDQLQGVQDQLQSVKRLLAAQQTETKRLAEQVGSLAGSIDSLRQSFASTQSSEAPSPPAIKNKSIRSRARAVKSRLAGAHRKRSKS
jgi:septal ring factor EnvC (AmiA/AmiB activator)